MSKAGAGVAETPSRPGSTESAIHKIRASLSRVETRSGLIAPYDPATTDPTHPPPPPATAPLLLMLPLPWRCSALGVQSPLLLCVLRRTFHRLCSVSLQPARLCSRWPRRRLLLPVPLLPPRASRWRKRPAKAAAVNSTARAAIAPSRVLAARALSAGARGDAASRAANGPTTRVPTLLTRTVSAPAPRSATRTRATCCPTASTPSPSSW